MYLSVTFVVFALIASGYAFNVDTRTAVVHRGPVGSMFGFDVAFYKDQTNSWTLIGAPKAQTRQPNVTEGGAVYRCNMDTATGCLQIAFDDSGSNHEYVRLQYEQTDDKSRQWFGATVDSTSNGLIVACAPRYVHFSVNLQRREPVGTCWIARNSMKTFEEYSPCRSPWSWGFHRQGYCQAGMSAAISENGNNLFVGAVGSYYWQGQVFSKNLETPELEYKTTESPPEFDDSFLGYSSAAGEFTGDEEPDVVVGMPRGHNLTGKVALFTSTMRNIQNISGEQMGSYFGYAVCVSDVNGDGLDDIVVGAPFYTDFDTKESKYEEGRVHIIYQNDDHKFETSSHLDGEYSKGRFGMSLASLKDINRDGFGDFAVGAPYAGSTGKGIVYVYHGSPSGVRDKPSQVITPDDFSDPGISTLGFSLFGGWDMDANEYPDILIGAYDSDRAIYMRSRPVVNISSSMKLSSEVVSLEDKNCVLSVGKDKTRVTCVEATFCLVYSGLGVASEIDITYNVTLDADQKKSRALFLKQDTSVIRHSLRLRKNIQHCNSTKLYVLNGIRDKLTPITVKAHFSLVDLEPYRHILKPVLNGNAPSYASKQLNIEKNCGKDNVCIPDLQLLASANMNQYSIGSSKRLELDIVIHNAKEDAFEAMLYVSMPLDVNFVNIDKSKLDFPVSCSGAQPEITGVNELVCDVGNPLPANKTLGFKILLAPSRIVSSVSDLVFAIVVNSTNVETDDTTFDNEEIIELPVRVEVSLILSGRSQPGIVPYNKSEAVAEVKVRETDIGPEVTHYYEVGNRGPGSIREAEVHILWPSYTLDGNPLLYMMSQPEVRGNAKCEKAKEVNPLNLQEIRRRPRHKTHVSVQDMKSHNALDSWKPGQNETSFERKRYRRESETSNDKDEETYVNDEEDAFEKALSCGPSSCTHITCRIFHLEKNEHVGFSIRSRLWRETYNTLGLSKVGTSSKIVTRITSLPYGVDPSYLSYEIAKVTTEVILDDVRLAPYIVPWWIIILAVCCGLLLLCLLMLLLWKLGFFKRKRPQELPEKEPLNERNGYRMTSGDAAL